MGSEPCTSFWSLKGDANSTEPSHEGFSDAPNIANGLPEPQTTCVIWVAQRSQRGTPPNHFLAASHPLVGLVGLVVAFLAFSLV